MNLEKLENGMVKINKEIANYDLLLENMEPIGEYETEDCGTLTLFEHEGELIEYLGDGCFIHGSEVNHTSLSFDEIMEHYNIK